VNFFSAMVSAPESQVFAGMGPGSIMIDHEI
jgi:hypothetical protein